MTNLPERLRAVAASLNEWDNPITGREDCEAAADLLERILVLCRKLAKRYSDDNDQKTWDRYNARWNVALDALGEIGGRAEKEIIAARTPK